MCPAGAATMTAEETKTSMSVTERPGTKVKFLLGVWGQGFILQFMELGLPTLLAPGNVPAVAAEYPCEFVFLTSKDDEEFLLKQPQTRALQQVCPVSFLPIDDLIIYTNYSTTLTLAYGRAVQACGPEMLNTYFVFLVSDYLMADGSLRSLLKHIRAGKSGIQAGNFQIIDHDLDQLRTRIDPETHQLAIPPRDLMAFALRHLHPVTVGNLVNQNITHSTHGNRLFWRVDDATLIGRFYLMHMLCIRPETTDFKIGASCDYSFIPEMCPSGDLAWLTDSDEYLVVEFQSGNHEREWLRAGPLNPVELAHHLCEWTTTGHRANAGHTLVFHAEGLPGSLPAAIAEADAYVAKIATLMAAEPQAHRNHPYWVGALTSFEAERKRLSAVDHSGMFLADLPPEQRPLLETLRPIFWALFGRAPNVRPWHHAWLDYRDATRALQEDLADPDRKFLTIAEVPNTFTKWLGEFGDRVLLLQATRFLRRPSTYSKGREANFGACFIFLTESELWRVDRVLDAVAPMLKADARVQIYMPNQMPIMAPRDFADVIASCAANFIRPGFRFVGAKFSRGRVQRFTRGLLTWCSGQLINRKAMTPVALLLLLPAYFLVLLDNIVRVIAPPSKGFCSSATVTLSANGPREKSNAAAVEQQASRVEAA